MRQGRHGEALRKGPEITEYTKEEIKNRGDKGERKEVRSSGPSHSGPVCINKYAAQRGNNDRFKRAYRFIIIQ